MKVAITICLTIITSFSLFSQQLPTGIVMKDIAAGTFTMGSNTLVGSPDQKAAAPEHQVTLSAYSLSEAEITNAQYVEFLNLAFADGLVEIVTGFAGPDKDKRLVQGTAASTYSGKVLYSLDGIRVLKDHEDNTDDNSFTGKVEPENPINISYIGFNAGTNQFYVKDPHSVTDFHWADLCDYQDYSETSPGVFEGPVLNDFADWSGGGANLSDELEGWTETNPTAATKLPNKATVSAWPVTFIRWWGATAFATYYGLTLPTEAQWEYAAKAGQNFEYGVHDGTEAGLTDANWNQAKLKTATGHVRSAISGTANPFGLYNLAGNCWEWIADNYVAPYATDAVTDPLIEVTGSTLRSWRGGAWNYHQETMQSALRFSDEENKGNDHFGFRVAGKVAVTTGATWDGSEGTLWSTTGNWSTDKLPTSTDNVTILSTTNQPVITGEATVNDIEIQTGASVTVESGGALAIFGSSTGDGTVTVKRNTTGNGGYSIVGAPVSGALVANLNADYLYQYNEPAADFTVPTGMMPPGKGFFVGYDATSPTVTLTGAPVSGSQSVMASQANDGFNLVANPYAAPISIANFLANTQNSTALDGSVYFWDDGGQNNSQKRGGDYITTNGMGSVGSSIVDLGDGISGLQGVTAAENGYITSLQGFFVHANSSGNVEFTADMQSVVSGANADANHYRNADSQKSLLKLALSNGTIAQEMLIGMKVGATSGVDHGLDALKFSQNEDLSFYSMIGQEKFAIQGVPFISDYTEVSVIDLGFESNMDGIFHINVVSSEALFEEYDVFLNDTELGIVTYLNETPSYQFDAKVGATDDRLNIKLAKKGVLSIATEKPLTLFGSADQLTIHYALQGAHTLAIYDLTGKEVMHQEVVFVNNQVTVANHGLAPCTIYMIKIGNESKKFILK